MSRFRRLFHNRVFWQGAVFASAGLVWLSYWAVTHDWSDPALGSGASGTARHPSDVPGRLLGLGEFAWPERNAWLAAHGIDYNAVTAEQLDRLRDYYAGSDDERERIRWECAKIYGLDGERIEMPRQDNLGCLAWRMERLTRGDVRSRESDVISLEMHARKAPPKAPSKDAKPARTQPASQVPRSETSWKVLVRLPYKTLIDFFSFKTYDEARLRVREAKAGGEDCTQATARAALMAGLEDFLPSREAWQAMSDLYGVTARCLPATHEAFERMHLRMGLLHLEHRELRPAATALAQALRAADPKDESRSHFWLGLLTALKNADAEGRIVPHRNPLWERLLEKLPLGVHALAIRDLRGEDALLQLEKNPRAHVSFYEGRRWDAFNLWSFLFTLAEAQGLRAAQERLVEHLAANFAPATFESSLFVAHVFKRMEEHRASIQTTLATLRRHGLNKLTPGVMSLLFPIHHQDVMKRLPRCRDQALVLSIIRQESSFSARAMGEGTLGLMQIQPSVATKLFPDRNVDLLNPTQNIEVGCAYLDYLDQEFDGDPILVMAAYNAGTPAVRRWQQRYDATVPLLFADLIPYAGTRYHVSNILAGRLWYAHFLKRAGESDVGNEARLLPEPGHFSLSEARELPRELLELPEKEL